MRHIETSFDSDRPIETYININNPLPENYLDIINLRIAYLKENSPKKLNEELAYLAATGSVGWWWWHEKRDHEEGIDKETKDAYSDCIKEFAALEAYITTNATKRGAIKAGEYLLQAATFYDNIDEDFKNIDNKAIKEYIWNREVVPRLMNCFTSCRADKNIGLERSGWWLEHQKGNHEKAAEHYLKEISMITDVDYEALLKHKKEIIDAKNEHDTKNSGWQDKARDSMQKVWMTVFSLRNDYILPYDRA